MRTTVLTFPASEAVACEARKLVHCKYELDRAFAERGAQLLAGGLHDQELGPAEPMPFLRRVLPFLNEGEEHNGSELVMVPTSHTLGCSWRWRPRNLDLKQRAEAAKKLTDLDSLSKKPAERASYICFPELGIVAPSEGKNRVDFFREEGLAAIPAMVSIRTYPGPERIRIYEVKERAFERTWAVLDARWLEEISHPSWALPLLRAYGVEVAKSWPSTFPRPELVHSAFFERGGPSTGIGRRGFGDENTVDLDFLQDRMARQEEIVRCAASDIADVRISRRLWAAAMATLLAGLAVWMLTPESWSLAKGAGGILVGAAFGASFIALAPIIRAPQRLVMGRQRSRTGPAYKVKGTEAGPTPKNRPSRAG
jgi:hypothetical protein